MPHTPGPWKIIYGGFRHDDGFAIGTDNAAASRVKVVAECWPCAIVDQEHRDELLANANLIAAAPDLFAACELAARCLNPLVKRNPLELACDQSRAKQMILAAIAKATENK